MGFKKTNLPWDVRVASGPGAGNPVGRWVQKARCGLERIDYVGGQSRYQESKLLCNTVIF